MKRIARKLTALLLSALMVGSVVTAGTASAGAAAVASWKDVDAGLDVIVEKTGASGESFAAMVTFSSAVRLGMRL